MAPSPVHKIPLPFFQKTNRCQCIEKQFFLAKSAICRKLEPSSHSFIVLFRVKACKNNYKVTAKNMFNTYLLRNTVNCNEQIIIVQEGISYTFCTEKLLYTKISFSLSHSLSPPPFPYCFFLCILCILFQKKEKENLNIFFSLYR